MAIKTVNDESLKSLANTIRSKGGTSEQLVFPEGFKTAINNIHTGVDLEGTAESTDVLQGKTFLNINGKQTGSIETYVNDHAIVPNADGQLIPTRGKYVETDILVNGDTNLVPENIKEGTSIFGIDGTAPTPKGNAQPENVMEGVNFSNDSGLQQGTMPIYLGEVHVKPSTTAQRLETAQHYIAEDVDVEGDSNLVPENIKKGISIFGITGSLEIPKGIEIKEWIPQSNDDTLNSDKYLIPIALGFRDETYNCEAGMGALSTFMFDLKGDNCSYFEFTTNGDYSGTHGGDLAYASTTFSNINNINIAEKTFIQTQVDVIWRKNSMIKDKYKLRLTTNKRDLSKYLRFRLSSTNCEVIKGSLPSSIDFIVSYIEIE